MKRNLYTTALCGGLGLFGGLFIATGAYKDLSKSLSLLALATLPTAYITHLIVDTRAVRRLNEEKRLKDTAIKEASDLYRKNEKLGVETAKLNQTIKQLELEKKQLTEKVESLAESLAACQNELPIKSNEIASLQTEITALQTTLTEHKEEIEELQAECEQWEQKFDELVEKASEEKFQIARVTELQRIFDEHDLVNQQFQNIIDRTMIWADKVRTSHANKSAFIKQMTRNFNETLDTVGEKIKTQEQAFLAEIELLREKVAVLQQQNAGEILEPEYLPRDFNRATDISNGIAHVLRHFYNVSLRVNGFEETEGSLRVGYAYSKSLDPQKLLDIFEKAGKDITKSLGLYSIAVSVDKLSPTFICSIKTERPKPPTDEQIYKDGLIPASQFCDQLFIATDHRKQGKPTLRVMAATGEGKGIAIKNLLSYFTEQDNWEIWLSDPVDESDEDYWDCPKMAKGVSQAGTAYQMFVDLHSARQAKAPTFTERLVVGVFDEFDKQHLDDDKEAALKIMTAIRHTKQRQILIGQCSEVGANGWTWDSMNNCALLVLGNSIGTLIKHLGKDMGWTITKVNKLKREHEKFKEWANAKNESEPDRPNENAYRIGLLIVGDRYSFLEVPSAHKGILRSGKGLIRDGLTTKPLQPQASEAPSVPASKSAYPKRLENEYECPDCSHRTQNFKDTTSRGTPRYVCESCGKKSVISKFKKIS
ncbi:hypothetical protein HW132_30880 [Brasilonema sp. CT11]|nr:hypothetical protein [Brasilonema sp. CT11]